MMMLYDDESPYQVMWKQVEWFKGHCPDLDLEHSNLTFFLHNMLAHENVLSNQVGLQNGQQFRKYGRNSHSLLI